MSSQAKNPTNRKKSPLRKPRKAKASLRLTPHASRERALEILRRLKARFPDARCELDYQNAFQLLIATILSAQCTDARVNLVTPALFARYPTPAALADADPSDVENLIRSTGFFRNKTKSLIGMARALVRSEEHTSELQSPI